MAAKTQMEDIPMPPGSERSDTPLDPRYSIDTPHRYRMDVPGGICRESLKAAIGMVVFTISIMAFALGIYLA